MGGGIDNIVEELRSLKELAINAANDSNTDEDRRTIQKEFVQRMDTINDIATTTAYNGKTLLDGTHAKKIVTSEIKPIIIPPGDYTITEDGVYSLADGYTGNITVNAQNVKLTQQTPATHLENVSIVTRAEGNSNLWIEDLNIVNTENLPIVRFKGSNNYLTVKGTNFLSDYPGDGDSWYKATATIDIANGLTIIGDGSLDVVASTYGVAIGSAPIGNAAGGNIVIAGYVTINAEGSYVAAIGSAEGNTVGDIMIGGNATVNAISGSGAGIGASYGTDIITEEDEYHSVGYYSYSRAGNIKIGGNANVTANGGVPATDIGTGAFDSSVGDITISSSAIVNATVIGKSSGDNTTVGTISIGKTTFDIEGIIEQTEPIKTSSEIFNELRIQSGDSANHAMNIFIEDMHTKSLGAGQLFDDDGNLINASDINRYNALSYDSTKQAEWLATLKAAENLTLDDISVTTRANANLAIRVIDGAIEYALDQATTVGAYLSRLEYTADNVTTSTENVQAAESTIRDADMAKAISGYTRYNVLTQAAQSMLAQANQNANAVLALLQ